MEYWNANAQKIRQVFDIARYFIIHETHAQSTECELLISKKCILLGTGPLVTFFGRFCKGFAAKER
jgi:hypothetical protein